MTGVNPHPQSRVYKSEARSAASASVLGVLVLTTTTLQPVSELASEQTVENVE